MARRDLIAPTGVSYYFSDHLKTASVITDSAGVIKAESDYYPWGGELQFVNADSNHYKFTGKERDSETDLDYFGARYYANILGRFVTPDWAEKAAAVPYAEFADPQSLNLYAYVRNIPTSKIDADGHWFWDLCIGEAIAVVEVGITAAEAFTAASFGAGLAAAAGGGRCYGPCMGDGPLPGTPHYKQMMADIQKQKQTSNQDDNAQSAPADPKKPGTLGKPDHQATAKDEAKKIDGKTEVKIPTPGGLKDSRRADAAQTDANGNHKPGGKIVQVIRPTKTGKVPKREKDAAQDIQNATGVKPTLVPVRPLHKETDKN